MAMLKSLGNDEPIESEGRDDEDSVTDEDQARRRGAAIVLCTRAQNETAWLMADRLARAWDLGGCEVVGVPWEGAELC